jgi:hypothetical protein
MTDPTSTIDLDEVRGSVAVVAPGEPDWDTARRAWNLVPDYSPWGAQTRSSCKSAHPRTVIPTACALFALRDRVRRRLAGMDRLVRPDQARSSSPFAPP